MPIKATGWRKVAVIALAIPYAFVLWPAMAARDLAKGFRDGYRGSRARRMR